MTTNYDYQQYQKVSDELLQTQSLLLLVMTYLRQEFDKGHLVEQWEMMDRINHAIEQYPLPADALPELKKRVRLFEYVVETDSENL